MKDPADPRAPTVREQTTHLLESIAQGDRMATDELVRLLYGELRRAARSARRRYPGGETLRTTVLVNEAYLHLVQNGDPGWEGRAHFMGAAAKAMRNVLVGEARKRGAIKRGGDLRRVEFADQFPANGMRAPEDILDLHSALEALAEQRPRQVRLVELICFAGLPVHEAGELLGVAPRTAERDWSFARRFLAARMQA